MRLQRAKFSTNNEASERFKIDFTLLLILRLKRTRDKMLSWGNPSVQQRETACLEVTSLVEVNTKYLGQLLLFMYSSLSVVRIRVMFS